MKTFMRLAGLVAALSASIFLAYDASAQSFVKHSGHPATYDDHNVPSTWLGGPTNVSVSLDSDGTLRDDLSGVAQRTATNTLNFVSPSAAINPQNYDNPSLIHRYGESLPLLQQLSAAGTSKLTYQFQSVVQVPLDLFITDVDQRDSVTVRAFDNADTNLDMSQWQLIDAGDLSLYKNTGTEFSDVDAVLPQTTLTAAAIFLAAPEDINYNRSYSILRSPTGQSIDRIEIDFTGTRNVASAALPGNGSHIYTALSTATPIPEPTFGWLVVIGLMIAKGTRCRKNL